MLHSWSSMALVAIWERHAQGQEEVKEPAQACEDMRGRPLLAARWFFFYTFITVVNNEWKATVKNVLEQKRSFVLAMTFGGLSIRRKWGNFRPLHLLETMKARGSAEQLHHISLKTLSLPFFYCPALSGCNRQGRKRGKIKIADVSNLSNSSPLKISAGVRCDPSIPARLITQRDKLLWWWFITE